MGAPVALLGLSHELGQGRAIQPGGFGALAVRAFAVPKLVGLFHRGNGIAGFRGLMIQCQGLGVILLQTAPAAIIQHGQCAHGFSIAFGHECGQGFGRLRKCGVTLFLVRFGARAKAVHFAKVRMAQPMAGCCRLLGGLKGGLEIHRGSCSIHQQPTEAILGRRLAGFGLGLKLAEFLLETRLGFLKFGGQSITACGFGLLLILAGYL